MNISVQTRSVTPLDSANSVTVGRTQGFSDVMGAAINQVEAAQASADRMASDLLVGGQGDVHSVALASQKAELSLELFQQVRNKFVQAYQELMKMPM